MKIRKFTSIVIAILLVSSALFTGCAARRPQTSTYDVNRTDFSLTNNGRWNRDLGNTANDYRFGYNNNYSYNYNNQANYNLNTRSDVLARNCNTVPGVKGATVVLSGDTAYCGIDIDRTNANTAQIDQIKKQCADKIRAADTSIKQVTVSADVDFLQRLQKINQGIMQGTPVESFRNELTQMVKRITPERE